MENLLYSYKKTYPKKLPFSLTLENGLTITELKNLSDNELKKYGFEGPHTIPVYDNIEENLVWTGEKFLVSKLNRSQILENILIDSSIFIAFFDSFKKSKLFFLVEQNVSKNLLLKLKYNQFLLSEEKLINIKKDTLIQIKNENIELLFSCINFFFNYFNLNENDSKEIEDILIKTKLNMFGKFIKIKSYESWILQEDGSTKLSPIPYPNDGKNYDWDESIKNWIEV